MRGRDMTAISAGWQASAPAPSGAPPLPARSEARACWAAWSPGTRECHGFFGQRQAGAANPQPDPWRTDRHQFWLAVLELGIRGCGDRSHDRSPLQPESILPVPVPGGCSMERPGLRARRLQTLDGMPCGKARRREKLGWKNGPSSFPQASIRKVMAQKRKAHLCRWAFRLEYGGSCRIRTYDQLVKRQLVVGLSRKGFHSRYNESV